MGDEFITDVTVRFRDLDPLNHVNNSVYSTYLEEARRAYLTEAIGYDRTELGFVLANLELSFETPVTIEDDLRVTVETVDVGRSSLRMAHEFRVDASTVATGETVIVAVDPDAGRPTPLDDDFRRRIREFDGVEVAEAE